VFCGQSHGRVEELGEGLAEVVQHELDLLPVRKTTNLFKRCNHLFRFHDFLTPIWKVSVIKTSFSLRKKSFLAYNNYFLYIADEFQTLNDF